MRCHARIGRNFSRGFVINGNSVEDKVEHQLDAVLSSRPDQRLKPVLDGFTQSQFRVEPVEIPGDEDTRIMAALEEGRSEYSVQAKVLGMREDLAPGARPLQHQGMHVVNLRWQS